MNRSDLINQLSDHFPQLTQRDAELAVTTIFESMSEAMARGGRIEIRDFGSFSIKQQAPRLGRNPRSGEPVNIAGKHVTHFKPGKALREAVDQEASRAPALTAP
jgi:integration host factor subunit beta